MSPIWVQTGGMSTSALRSRRMAAPKKGDRVEEKVRMRPELVKLMQRLAELHHRSRNEEYVTAIEEYVARRAAELNEE